MISFDVQSTGTYDQPPSTSTSASGNASVDQFYVMSDQSQKEWRRHLATTEMQFTLTHDCIPTGTNVNNNSGSFDPLVYDDAALFNNDQDNEIDDAIKAARQAKRKAQNRVAQRKFRERKDSQVKALEAEIANLKDQVNGSRSQILDLQDALTEAKTQVETLKSILPSIAKYEPRATDDFPMGEGDKTAVLSMILSSLMRSGKAQSATDVFVTTPVSSENERWTSYS